MNQASVRSANHAKQCARRLALQALYQWQFTNNDALELIQQYQEDEYWSKSDQDFFMQLIHGCIEHVASIDADIASASEYEIAQIDPIELAALRIAVFEFTHCTSTPATVVIAEAIRLCKRFGSDDGFKLVNAILDALAKRQ